MRTFVWGVGLALGIAAVFVAGAVVMVVESVDKFVDRARRNGAV